MNIVELTLPYRSQTLSASLLPNVNECMNYISVIPQKEYRKNNKYG